MPIATVADRDAIQNEMPWEKRDVPKTLHEMLARTGSRNGNKKAFSFQLLEHCTNRVKDVQVGSSTNITLIGRE